MSKYIVKSSAGDRIFNREEDAYDYAIKLMRQACIKSEIKEI